MRVLFWGTPEFAVPSLRALAEEGHDVVGVVTQPDRPAGRGRQLRASPVKEVAAEEGYVVLTPEKPRGPPFLDSVRALEPELSVVVAYGHILVREVLDLPPLGSINVHASLLPALRGAAPINWAIARGLETTGVTIMRMVEEMDAGPILFQAEEPIEPGETATELTARLSEVGAEALIEALELMRTGELIERRQDDALATFAPKVDRRVARIDWALDARAVADHVRAMDEVPGAWTSARADPLKLFRPTLLPERPADAPPGTVVSAEPQSGLVVATGDGVVGFGEVQPAGGRRMRALDWIRGRHVVEGDVFA